MIICKFEDYAFQGTTVAEAYEKFLDSEAVNDLVGPQNLEWFSATPMKLVMSLASLVKPAQPKKAGK